jgi:hypothetical protein
LGSPRRLLVKSRVVPDSPTEPKSFRQFIRRLHPYYCLILLAIPMTVVEPLKMAGFVIVGTGRWLAGVVILAFAYLLSFLLVRRLFRIVQPRLLALKWFRNSRSWVLERSQQLSDTIICKRCVYPIIGPFISRRAKPAHDRSHSPFPERSDRHRPA